MPSKAGTTARIWAGLLLVRNTPGLFFRYVEKSEHPVDNNAIRPSRHMGLPPSLVGILTTGSSLAPGDLAGIFWTVFLYIVGSSLGS